MELGDTRAIPALIGRLGSNLQASSVNETADVEWALRILSARALPERQDWRRWWAGRPELPAHSPLMAPYQPLKLGAQVQASGTAEHVCVDGKLAFVGGRSSLEIFDVANPAAPRLIDRYRVDEQGIEQLLAQRGRLFFTTHAGGLHVYQYDLDGYLEHLSTRTGSKVRVEKPLQ